VGLRKGNGMGLNTVRISGRQLTFKLISLLFTEVLPRWMLKSVNPSHKRQAKDSNYRDNGWGVRPVIHYLWSWWVRRAG